MKKMKNTHSAAMVIRDRLVLDVSRLSSYYLIDNANKMTRNSSTMLRKEFGIGVVEFRLMAGLAREPDIPASQLRKYTLTDKGLTSRALKSLEEKGLIETTPQVNSIYRKTVRLTSKGYECHDKVLPTILERELFVMADFDDDEIEQFFRMLKHISIKLDEFKEKNEIASAKKEINGKAQQR